MGKSGCSFSLLIFGLSHPSFSLCDHSLGTGTSHFPWEPSSSLDFFPLNLPPSSPDPQLLSQKYLPHRYCFIEPSFLFRFPYPSWAGILTASNITKDRAQVWSLIPGSPDIVASPLCPSPGPTELVPVLVANLFPSCATCSASPSGKRAGSIQYRPQTCLAPSGQVIRAAPSSSCHHICGLTLPSHTPLLAYTCDVRETHGCMWPESSLSTLRMAPA